MCHRFRAIAVMSQPQLLYTPLLPQHPTPHWLHWCHAATYLTADTYLTATGQSRCCQLRLPGCAAATHCFCCCVTLLAVHPIHATPPHSHHCCRRHCCRCPTAAVTVSAAAAAIFTALQVAASNGFLDVVLRLVTGGAVWRGGRGGSGGPGPDADVVKLLVRKGNYKVRNLGRTCHFGM